ncbi:hypothetical protein ACH5RR_004258 [Cinchona calisaya]|uniref:Uncharacterized protein n=1 Tax=Cinchona calisaya TaxID=153742 RepID=A0ABD3AXY5_9GENT
MGNIHFGALLLLLFPVEITVSYRRHHQDVTHTVPDNPSIKYAYMHFPEIEKHCGFLSSSASELPPDDNRAEKNEETFLHVWSLVEHLLIVLRCHQVALSAMALRSNLFLSGLWMWFQLAEPKIHSV